MIQLGVPICFACYTINYYDHIRPQGSKGILVTLNNKKVIDKDVGLAFQIVFDIIYVSVS